MEAKGDKQGKESGKKVSAHLVDVMEQNGQIYYGQEGSVGEVERQQRLVFES